MIYDNNYIFLPNEIFDDLLKLKYRRESHFIFTISYYCLISFLYRFHYDFISPREIKKMLGYNPDYKDIDYIIKKDGLLDKFGYTVSTSDHPIEFKRDNLLGDIIRTISEYNKDDDKYRGTSHRQQIKLPVKCMHRTRRDLKNNELTGTYFYSDNAIKLEYKTFMDIIKNKELGCSGFLIYLFIRKHYQGLMMGYENIANNLLMTKMTVINKIKILKDLGYINVKIHRSYPDNNKCNIYNAVIPMDEPQCNFL